MPTSVELVIVTAIPSPYQVELFNALAAQGGTRLRVIYLHRTAKQRDLYAWETPDIAHEHLFLNASSTTNEARAWVDSADLVVFSDYSNAEVRRWMSRRALAARAWCYWGERPGFRGWGVLGALYRRFRLSALYNHRAPIWGIGNWAVEGWSVEFGAQRFYRNVPYYSDLSRFSKAINGEPSRGEGARFLFSGALIPRKGVDLLASAFTRLAKERSDVYLDLMGSGPLEPALRHALAPLRDRTTFHGFQEWRALPAIYSRADILCVPSRYDGWALVVPEGLASALPVITTDRVGAARDLIRHGRNGWITRAGHVDELFQAMKEAAGLSPHDRWQRSRRARESVSEHSLEHGVRVFLEAVHSTMESSTAVV